MNEAQFNGFIPNSWTEIAAFLTVLTVVIYLLRRLVVAELHNWKTEMTEIMNRHREEMNENMNRHREQMESQFVSKEMLGLRLEVIAARQDATNAALGEVKVLLTMKGNYEHS